MAKSEIDINRLGKAAERLHAIAHPTRIAIISLLGDNVELSVSDISIKLNITQPKTSFHLKALKDKDILMFKRDGKQIIYSLNYDNILKTIEFIDR